GKVKGKFTLNDAASMTGIPVEEARTALNQLMEKYVCRLVVTENGDMVYDFGRSPQRRGEKTWAERWSDIKAFLWKAFTIFFKVWITLMLVVYFVIFVVLVIAAIVAMTASNRDGDSGGGSSDSLGGGKAFRAIGDMFYSIFIWNTILGRNRTYYATDSRGYRYKHYQQRTSPLNENKKNFISSVYDFVFGPPRVEPEPLENQKEVAAYARQSKGIVVIPEFKALAGWTTDEARSFMTDCVVRFNGSAEISPNAVLYADFEDLTRSVNQASDGKVEWYWNEYEPEYEITGNSSGRNAGVIFMNLFNLAGGSFFLYQGYMGSAEIEMSLGMLLGLGWVPFLFSLIFFSVPVLRMINIAPKRKKRQINNIRKRLIKIIYKHAGQPISLRQLEQEVNRSGEEKLGESTIQDIMSKLVIDWGGFAEPTTEGTLIYHFEQLKLELEEAQQLRKGRQNKADLGDTYFDTKELE
ncbi:MAG: hypothetical protein AAF734_08030, partial [Bacteroidota bacterium]